MSDFEVVLLGWLIGAVIGWAIGIAIALVVWVVILLNAGTIIDWLDNLWSNQERRRRRKGLGFDD